MTTEMREAVRCSVCGLESEFTVIGSTNAIGYPDLDTRPPPMQRSTIFAWVQRCPGCGYCAADVSEPCVTPEITTTEECKRQMSDNSFPVLANSFLCKALLDKAKGDLRAATWARIHAAWACDDANFLEQARDCRKYAAELLVLAEAKGKKVCDQRGLSTAILVDLLRRAGEIKRAKEVLARPSGVNVDQVIRKMLKLQIILVERNDQSRRSVGEALAT